ncbi:hypothetical protein CDCA_CDCA07G2275 [Cyanidium caldarium]|uniref:L-2-hydroxyglutarate dehydrogenase, mitochondrial n=1 Tax=Cyanidium caldarium TaxID=2771 RepID=A0AAV9IVX8_CYACA|nr:hypothetical protein CDCA_CDCA07G2275 [Cyanidium caldarium]
MRVAVVGGGLVGLAVARHLWRRTAAPQLVRLTLFERAPVLAAEQSSHNSGVIHSGLAYRPGSLKAKLCVEGAARIYAYGESEAGVQVPMRRVGKWIVATDEAEAQRLEPLLANAVQNGVRDVSLHDRIPSLPAVRAVRALHSPHTGVIDYAALARAFAREALAIGGERCEVRTAVPVDLDALESEDEWLWWRRPLLVDRRRRQQLRQEHRHWQQQWDWVVVCVGAATRPSRHLRIVPFRGQYYELATDAVQRLGLGACNVYPVADPRFPFLGVHFTPSVDGRRVWVGPTASLAGWPPLHYPGFWRLALPYAGYGLREWVRERVPAVLARSLQRLVPSLRARDLRRSFDGVRAQAVARDGTLVDDFCFHRVGNILHVRNAPSPAATSCMAIARYIVEEMMQLLP